jgi:nicotinate-nucleotide adenylyltransferase
MHRSAPVRFGHIGVQTPYVGERQRVGLLGGSFNPPHAAHILISEIALRRLGLDAIWWLVTPGNPLKSGRDLVPLASRIAACRAMTGHRRIHVTGLEACLKTPFTAATIDHLKMRHPGVRFVWLMGADCLAQFHHWRQWRGIMATIPVAVIDRPGWHLKSLASPAAGAFARFRSPEARARTLLTKQVPAWTFLTGPLHPASSTAIRVAEKTRKSASASSLHR